MKHYPDLDAAQDAYPSPRYLILDDQDADKKARDEILESIWAFNPSFLASHTDLTTDDVALIQSNLKGEGNNSLFIRLIKDLDHFVDDAVKSDGRGHFISHYDGEETEIHIDNLNETFYVYRVE